MEKVRRVYVGFGIQDQGLGMPFGHAMPPPINRLRLYNPLASGVL